MKILDGSRQNIVIKPASNDDLSSIVDLFFRLDTQAIVFLPTCSPTMLSISESQRLGLESLVPLCFASLSEAENVLDKLPNWSMYFDNIHGE